MSNKETRPEANQPIKEFDETYQDSDDHAYLSDIQDEINNSRVEELRHSKQQQSDRLEGSPFRKNYSSELEQFAQVTSLKKTGTLKD